MLPELVPAQAAHAPAPALAQLVPKCSLSTRSVGHSPAGCSPSNRTTYWKSKLPALALATTVTASTEASASRAVSIAVAVASYAMHVVCSAPSDRRYDPAVTVPASTLSSVSTWRRAGPPMTDDPHAAVASSSTKP